MFYGTWECPVSAIRVVELALLSRCSSVYMCVYMCERCRLTSMSSHALPHKALGQSGYAYHEALLCPGSSHLLSNNIVPGFLSHRLLLDSAFPKASPLRSRSPPFLAPDTSLIPQFPSIAAEQPRRHGQDQDRN